jgi:hypothetical protein
MIMTPGRDSWANNSVVDIPHLKASGAKSTRSNNSSMTHVLCIISRFYGLDMPIALRLPFPLVPEKL